MNYEHLGIFPNLAFEALKCQVVSTTVRLGVADGLGDGPRSAGDVAKELGLDEHNLARLLRALTALGFVEQISAEDYKLTEKGTTLRAGAFGPLTQFISTFGNPAIWRAIGSIEQSVRTGVSGFESAFCQEFYDYLADNEDLAYDFNGFMDFSTQMIAPQLVHLYDFSAARHVVDVGGGDGTLLAKVLKSNPQTSGTVFDTKEGTAGIEEVLDAAGLRDRCATDYGDFLTGPVTPGADVYLLKNIMQDWSDENCVAIMRNCREAAAQDGRILLLLPIIPDWDAEIDPAIFSGTALTDVLMMALTGRDRTEQEIKVLIDAAGLKINRTFNVQIPNSDYRIIETTSS